MSGHLEEPWGLWPKESKRCPVCGNKLGGGAIRQGEVVYCSEHCANVQTTPVGVSWYYPATGKTEPALCPWCNANLTPKDGKAVCPNGCGDKAEVAPSSVVSPPHYTAGGIETIDFIKAKLTPDEFRGYLKGSIIKYLSRANLKGAAEQDYAKASFYATMLTGEDPREVS